MLNLKHARFDAHSAVRTPILENMIPKLTAELEGSITACDDKEEGWCDSLVQNKKFLGKFQGPTARDPTRGVA